MKKYGLNELREMYLSYFEKKNGHLRLPSFSLVPKNDNSLLLINAGMAPLKPYFTGQEVPPRRRVTTCQKCIRTGDIENVGKDGRHATFFEMLGNFSFGDYFKHEAIRWTWEFLTDVVGLDPDRLYPSVYLDDDEAYDIWNKEIGVPKERIYKFGKEDNFWEHGAGPCGPCTEVYYDRGEKYGCGKPTCAPGCDCDRYMEVWNNVFTQFENDGNGNYTTLKQKNIDTGMGLERLAMIVQEVDSIFDVDTIKAIRDKICELAHVEYEKGNPANDVSIRVITDHIRSVTFMASDGILPSNEGRGYVMRRLLRRAARHGRLLGIHGAFLNQVAETVIENSKDAYPELEEKKEHIFSVLGKEEENFNRTIDQGLSILNQYTDELTEKKETVLSGEKAFKLYDTYGFPIDLTKEILGEKGISVDEDGFHQSMEIQQQKARAARKKTNYMGADATIYEKMDPAVTTEFDGFDKLEKQSDVVYLTRSVKTEDGSVKTELADTLSDSETGSVIVKSTPFYGTMGGQVGDTGIIRTENGTFVVQDTIHVSGDKIAHIGYVESGEINVGDLVTLTVDKSRRLLIENNHTATHLLLRALKNLVGNHVTQQGSYVDDERLRFDFSHNQALTKEQLQAVEDLVNEKIQEDLPVTTEVLSLAEARKTGAEAIFDEKYGEVVRVVSIGDFDKEFCGGTHVSSTGKIRLFKIVSESGIASGVRRIEALTDLGVIRYYQDLENILKKASEAGKVSVKDVPSRIEALQEEVRTLQNENKKLNDKLAKQAASSSGDQAVQVGSFKVLPVSVKDVDMNSLRTLGDEMKDKIQSGVVILASEISGKVNLIVTATDDAVKAGLKAPDLIRRIAPKIGGGGGGRPNMAQAGGKNPAGIADALKEGVEAVKEILKES